MEGNSLTISDASFTIKRLTIQNCDEVSDLDKTSKENARKELDTKNYNKSKMIAYGIYDKDKLIGRCTLADSNVGFPPEVKALPEYNKDSFMLFNVFVRPEYRGRGIASKLVKTAIQRHPDIHKDNNIFLIVFDKKLYDFYSKIGFKVIDDYIMIKGKILQK
jgi:GNAT superfamily N-acetyltransferase